jgi:hypothetical protein
MNNPDRDKRRGRDATVCHQAVYPKHGLSFADIVAAEDDRAIYSDRPA